MLIRHRRYCAAFGLVFAIGAQGCGGGGGSSSGTSTTPSALTKAHVTSHLAALGQGALSLTFASYGQNANTHHGAVYFLPMLGLYDRETIAPDGINHKLTLDSSQSQTAGQLRYISEDVGLAQSGSLTITAGRYAGLSGNYLLSVVTGGSSGNEAYSIPNVATTSGEFSLINVGSTNTSGTEQFAVALASGYTQNEQVLVNANGSNVFTTTDVNNETSVFNFAADGSGRGAIKGSEPGLPASVVWDVTGSGTVTYADNSTATLSFWNLSSSSPRQSTRTVR